MAIKVQLVLFCIVFVALLALTECKESNGVENIMASNDIRGRKLTFCIQAGKSGPPGSDWWCCAFHRDTCWKTHEACDQGCHP
ncbi:hypothetical protein PRUPE_7G129400 [Prunus persica]|uniref:PREDICTED: PRUPE_7G129400 n=2 Tax=Prunus TaxID=3754 RepID=A0A5E4E2S6_PRUDU|nr:hypothetical protein L3X38_038986 [Prunus dulcis]KAI5319467.1 hypothetical protein L3X38_039175 [Prunus dulcis]ONH96442.1 hypothetical protein PRUPE_7G129400 [Prunus persica]VVA09626.1 PREDICTED: PRUPE_7G129400 [Prunus dulcis]